MAGQNQNHLAAVNQQTSSIATALRGSKTPTEQAAEAMTRGMMKHFPKLQHWSLRTVEGLTGFCKQIERLLTFIKLMMPGVNKTDEQHRKIYEMATTEWNGMTSQAKSEWAANLNRESQEWWTVIMSDAAPWQRILCIFIFHSLDGDSKRDVRDVMKIADPCERYRLLQDKLRSHVSKGFRDVIVVEWSHINRAIESHGRLPCMI